MARHPPTSNAESRARTMAGTTADLALDAEDAGRRLLQEFATALGRQAARAAWKGLSAVVGDGSAQPKERTDDRDH